MAQERILSLSLEISKNRGFPCLWEAGGGKTSTGWSVIIAGPSGEKLRPLFVKNKGHLSCGEHALFVVKIGYVIIRASHYEREFDVTLSVIKDLNLVEKKATCVVVADFSEGLWTGSFSNGLYGAIEAAIEKATCYHCRHSHWSLPLVSGS